MVFAWSIIQHFWFIKSFIITKYTTGILYHQKHQIYHRYHSAKKQQPSLLVDCSIFRSEFVASRLTLLNELRVGRKDGWNFSTNFLYQKLPTPHKQQEEEPQDPPLRLASLDIDTIPEDVIANKMNPKLQAHDPLFVKSQASTGWEVTGGTKIEWNKQFETSL